MDLHNFRDNYNQDELLENNLPEDPIVLFHSWMESAISVPDIKEPNAMALATSTLDGKPSVRIVLLKKIGDKGFVFYTNYNSRKGIELSQNPKAACTIWWPPLQRQVRIEGSVEQISQEASKVYFDARPEGSRRGAIVSPQSNEIPNRDFLEDGLKELINSDLLDKPDHWGGYILIPNNIEFWQGRENRLHDRILYRRQTDKWSQIRLAP